MTDPFDALRTPVDPVDPDPIFAVRLRARLVRALNLPEGVDMPRTALNLETLAAIDVPQYPGVSPNLAVADARRALAWYADTLGARPRGEPIVMPDGRIGHAELELAGSVVMMADEHPEIGFVAPVPGRGTAVMLHLEVADVDTLARRAVEAGALLDRPPEDNPYGRNAVIVDPFGHRWMISSTSPAAEPATSGGGPRHGDISFASLWLPDVGAAADFYSAVLGWRIAAGSSPQGRLVEGLEPVLGLWGGQEHRTTLLCFAVEDVAAAVDRVRAAGGEAGDPHREPYGVVADCVDDQGMPFAFSESSKGTGPHDEARSPRHGELAYLTIGVPDTRRAQVFFSAVLGWSFTPGHKPDGWNIEGVRPMAGMHGGADVAVVVPMYAVDDIETAAARVGASGGTATDPERMPYGTTSDCTDDQGTSFYLGQLS